jgi:hypothetical protein
MKQVVFRVDDELYKKSKVRAVLNNQNMTEYLTMLMADALRKEESNAGTESN